MTQASGAAIADLSVVGGAARTPYSARRRTLRAGHLAGRAMLYALVLAGAVTYAMPFVWMLSTAVKPGYQVYLVPPVWFPDTYQIGRAHV